MTRRVFESFDIGGGRALNIVSMIVLSLLLFLGSIYIYSYVQKTVEAQKRLDFDILVDNHIEKIKRDSRISVDYLYDLRGKLATGLVDDKEWRRYIAASGLEQRYPGFLSVAYVERIDKSESLAFAESVKKLYSPVLESYSIFPTTDNKDLYPIKFMYSFDTDLQSLLGYDVGSSENLSKTMLETSISGRERITPLLALERIITGSNKAGYSVMIPVYSNVGSLELVPEERRKYIVGFVGAFLKPKDMFLGMGELPEKGMVLTVFDQGKKVYEYQQDVAKGHLKLSREVNILGKSFHFEFENLGTSILPSSYVDQLSVSTLIGLIAINAFWYLTFITMMLTQRRSQRLTKDATEDLRKFKQAVDGVSDLVIITDNEGSILYANDAIVRATGFSRKEIIGRKPSLWGRQMERVFYNDFWKTIKVDKKPFWGELKNKRKNGELYEVELRVWPILNEEGNVLYYVGIERDITKTKAVERMKTEFISLASHQLRTPLSAVKWFGKMLIDGEAGDLTKTQKEYLNKIYESNEREIQLVNSLLNVSRIESGRIKIEPKETDMKQLVESIISDVEVGLNKSVRKIKLSTDKELPSMLIDPDLMRHVYLNLLTNAVRYTKENGRIDVTVKVKDGNMITKISDDGIGIPEAEQGRMFEKFFRGSNALKKETDGSGLGLYLARSVIESSGGKIWFKSKENVGTTFWFSLPIDNLRV